MAYSHSSGRAPGALPALGAVVLGALGLLAASRLVRQPGAASLRAPSPDVPLGRLNDPRVLVEKSARRLTVYDGGAAVKTYRAAVGAGRGDKVREGDRRTPEGDFYICLRNPESRFTLSLGLSYPNVEDAARGLRDGLITPEQHRSIVEAIRAGERPDWYTPLGGEIMIHGGLTRMRSTAGCVALADDDIRELYHALPVGTPVRIAP